FAIHISISTVEVRIAVCPYFLVQTPFFVGAVGFCPTLIEQTLVFVTFDIAVCVKGSGYFFYFFYVFHATVIAVINAVIHLRYFFYRLGIAVILIADVWKRLGISSRNDEQDKGCECYFIRRFHTLIFIRFHFGYFIEIVQGFSELFFGQCFGWFD